jgi:two-component system, OmpR family, sensor histidine kinase CreC
VRISVRVFLGFFLIVGLAAFLVLHTFMQEVRPGVRQGMEVALVDTAHLLAEIAAPELKDGTLANGKLAQAIRSYRDRQPNARIWGVVKNKADFRVYVTDDKGILLFDSDGTAPGADYSRLNDVYLTLQGRYGARSTLTNPKDQATSVMHVAAPILDQGRIIGVLTVATPTSSVMPFAERSQNRVFNAGLGLMGAALLIGVGLSLWLTRSINRLMDYAKKVTEGHKVVMPSLGARELADLGKALETMRIKLDGRQYVERYVHTLTHEMKSPLTAIHGAAELLEEDMPEEDRHRFIANIREQEERLQNLVERMLGLASVEQKQSIENPVRISLSQLSAKILAAKESQLALQSISVDHAVPEDAYALGDAFLLEQALSNLIDNAIDFSPPEGRIALQVESTETSHTLCVRDQGNGIPDFALERIFEPFYSLPRPGTHRKSTGLGLSFVRQVAELHGGAIDLSNHPEGGAESRLRLPKA